jgi:hypothetical protein
MSVSGVDSGYPDYDRLQGVLADTGATVDWLVANGIEFSAEPYAGSVTYPMALANGGGAGLINMLVAAAAANLHTCRTTENVTGETRAVERRRALAAAAVAGAEMRHRLVHNTIDSQNIVVEHILALVIQEVVVVNFVYTLLKLNLRSLSNGTLLTYLTTGNFACSKTYQ